ncbi:MAG: 1-acyl-sn-glycerol-3-phosphate acyltransferase [Candidatus Kerfeldbacteria bacterium]|nr:1-acyl-sn-glycerol-3-phosphate acyltransferase [Candidatus Kerfeldbacteria bacterium]
MAYPLLRHLVVPLVLRHIGRIEGEENIPLDRPFLAASNHVSYVEPALLAAVIVRATGQRIYALTWYRIWRVFHAFGLAGWLGMVPVVPAEPGKVLHHAMEMIARGHPILIFPEGKRNFDGGLLKAHTGAARLALLSGIPVLPIGYQGPPARTIAGSLGIFFRDGKQLRVTIGTPLVFPKMHQDELTRERLDGVSRDIMIEIGKLCNQPYQH